MSINMTYSGAWLKAGMRGTDTKGEQREQSESDVACTLYHFRTRSKQAPFTCETEARTGYVPCDAEAQRASLRGVFAPFFGKAKIRSGLSLSTGATGREGARAVHT